MVAKIFIVGRRLIGFIVVIARRRLSTIAVPPPRRFIAPAEIHLSPFRVGIVSHRKHRSSDSVEQFRRGLSLLVTTARDIARAYEDWRKGLARYSSGIAK